MMSNRCPVRSRQTHINKKQFVVIVAWILLQTRRKRKEGVCGRMISKPMRSRLYVFVFKRVTLTTGIDVVQ